MIKRYDPDYQGRPCYVMVECEDGNWAEYEDHEAEVAKLKADNEKLRKELNKELKIGKLILDNTRSDRDFIYEQVGIAVKEIEQLKADNEKLRGFASYTVQLCCGHIGAGDDGLAKAILLSAREHLLDKNGNETKLLIGKSQ